MTLDLTRAVFARVVEEKNTLIWAEKCMGGQKVDMAYVDNPVEKCNQFRPERCLELVFFSHSLSFIRQVFPRR